MSDDIPIIFAEELRREGRAVAPSAVFLSGASTVQMQQYATAGWKVLATPGFRSDAEVSLADVPAVQTPEAGTSARHIKRWRPDFLKFNCAFYDISDAGGLAQSVAGLGYMPLVALWRDDNSFGLRSLSSFGGLANFPNLEWDRTNLIGVRDGAMAHTLMTIARLYVGEERRIADLRVANSLRNDFIARLEDALQAHQKP